MWQFLIAFFVSFPVFAQTSTIALDEIIVSSKSTQTANEILAPVEIISREEIESSGESNVINFLEKLGSFDITQSGGSGSQTTFYYRGLEMRHMLVLIDGVKVSDPSNTDRHFDFSKLDLSDVEKIEIIKGASSVLYGSEAIAGVLNIITTKASDDSVSIKLRDGIQKSLWIKMERVGKKYRFNLQNSLSEANYQSSAKNGSEFDRYQSQNYSGFYEYFITDKIFINFLAKIQKSAIEFDSVDFPSGRPIDNYENKNFDLDQIYSQNLEIGTDTSKTNLKISHHRIDRKIVGEGPALFTGKSNQVEINHSGKFANIDFIVGADSEKELIDSLDLTNEATTSGVYSKLGGKLSGLSWDVGLRSVKHSLFSSILVGGAGIGLDLDSSQKIKLNYGTGFKSPSLYQLYSPPFGSMKIGNEKLMPERSKNIDLSYELTQTNIRQKLSFFYYEVNDLIDFGANGYENLDSFRTKGVEYSFLYVLSSLQGEFVLSSQNFDKKTPLRRSHEKIQANLSYFLKEKHQVELQNRWHGYRYDEQGGKSYKLSSYAVSDLAYYYHLNKAKLGIKINNLFNDDYELLKGYSVNRRNFMLEASATF